jgi:tetratricopeptide (TPR) repeat protein
MSSLSISPQVSTELMSAWKKARSFSLQPYHIEAPIGTGSKHVINQFQRDISTECFTWHVRFRENLYGWEILPTLTNGLWKTLRHSKGISELVQEQLKEKLDDSRMQGILDSMAESLQKALDSNGEKLVLPKENPLMGLVLVARTLMSEFPMLFIFENLHQCHSYQPFVFLQAILEQSEKTRTMVVVQTEPINDRSSMWMPEQLLHLLRNNNFNSVGLEPWSLEEISTYLHARNSELDPELVLLWTDGRQECVAELLDWIDEDDFALEAFESKTLRLAESIKPELGDHLLRLGALFGWRFPIEPLAKMLKIEVDEAKTLLEEQSHLVEIDEDMAVFKRVLHQLRLSEDTIRNLPEAAGTTADNIYAYIGRSRPDYLISSAKIYAKLERYTEAHECTKLFWDLDDDVLWLAMLEITIRWGLEYPPYLMAPIWIRSAKYQFAHNPEQAFSFQERALRWAIKNDIYEVAADLLRQGGRFLYKIGQHSEAEKQFSQALDVVITQNDEFLNADIRIDMVEMYVGGKENRRAAEQLLLLEKLSLTQVQRIRLIGIHARISQIEEDHSKAAALFLESRKLASQILKWGIATDSTLLAIEALLDDNKSDEARKLLTFISEEAIRHDRVDSWKLLHIRCTEMEEKQS